MDAGALTELWSGGDSDTVCGLAGLAGLVGLACCGLEGGGFTSGSTLRRTCKGASGAGGFGLPHHGGNRLACKANDNISAMREPRRDRNIVSISPAP